MLHLRFFKSSGLALGLFLVLLSRTRAGEYFVSPAGNDAADGSLGAPFRTIAKALSMALPGDSVELRAGTYRELVNPPRSGTAGSPITIENYQGEQAVISALD